MVLFIILQWPDKPIHTSFTLRLPTNRHSTNEAKVFNMDEFLHSWKEEQRGFEYFSLTGDTIFDKLTLCAVAYETRQMHLKNDTTHVIKVHFKPESTYGQFVYLLNAMHLEMQPCYAATDDDFYIWEINENNM